MSGSGRHIADAESLWRVVNITPDFCRVNGVVVPFDIYKTLPPERSDYAKKVRARGEKVLHVASIVQGVIGNMGQGVKSGVSQGAGDTMIIEGARTVRPDGIAPAPLPPITAADLTQGPTLVVHKHGMVVDNAVYGRVRTKMCYADRREERLDDLRQDWNQNKDLMTAEEANSAQSEMSSIQNSINPGEQSLSSGPTAAQQAFFQQQKENWEDIEATEDTPFGFVGPALQRAGMKREKAHAVSVLLNAGAALAKPGELKAKIGYKPPFQSSPYE